MRASTKYVQISFVFALCASMCATRLFAADADIRLVEASKGREWETVFALVRERVDVNTPQPDGATALHWAVHWDDAPATTLLIGNGAAVDATNEYGVTPLFLACTNGNLALTELLLTAGANPRTVLPSGETLLMTAARTGKAAVVSALLAYGADVEAVERMRGQSALMWAIAEGHAEVVELLLTHGADASLRSKSGFTPLLFAAREGAREIARLLLTHGADVNEADANGATALLVATVRGHVEFAKFLLDQGANPNAAAAGYAPLHWATGQSESLMAHDYPGAPGEWAALGGLPTPEAKAALVTALLAHGADVNARTTKDMPRYGFSQFKANYLRGATPFVLAAEAGDIETMRLLLTSGADPKLTADDGTTALILAAGLAQEDNETRVSEAAHLEATKLAYEVGIDLNAANKGGFNALHGAAVAGFDSVVQFLADQGIKLNERTLATRRNDGGGQPAQTALGIAEGSNFNGFFIERLSTAALLRTLGAISEGAVNLNTFMEQQEKKREEQNQSERKP